MQIAFYSSFFFSRFILIGDLPAAFSRNTLKLYQENVFCSLHDVSVVRYVQWGRGIVGCGCVRSDCPAALLSHLFRCLFLVVADFRAGSSRDRLNGVQRFWSWTWSRTAGGTGWGIGWVTRGLRGCSFLCLATRFGSGLVRNGSSQGWGGGRPAALVVTEL